MAPYLIVWGYVGIYRRKEYVVEQRGAHEGGGRAQGGRRAPYLVASWKLLLRRVQVSWILFVPKITLPKVSFRLDSV